MIRTFVSAAVFLAFGSTALAQGEVERSLFESENKNLVEPENLTQISKIFPMIMEFGYAGKVLLEFDINADGKAQNTQVIAATRPVMFDTAAMKILDKFKFAEGRPMEGVHYEMSFCLKSDRVTPVFCDIRFKRVAGPERPFVIVYSTPYYASHAARKGYCGWVRVGFNVDALGQAQDIRVLESSKPGQFEISLRRSLERFQFEKNTPAEGIEYRVSFGLPGRCEVE